MAEDEVSYSPDDVYTKPSPLSRLPTASSLGQLSDANYPPEFEPQEQSALLKAFSGLDIKDFTTLGEHLRRLDLHENTVEVLALVEYFHASTHEGADQDDDGTVLGRIWAALKSYITSSENTDLEKCMPILEKVSASWQEASDEQKQTIAEATAMATTKKTTVEGFETALIRTVSHLFGSTTSAEILAQALFSTAHISDGSIWWLAQNIEKLENELLVGDCDRDDPLAILPPRKLPGILRPSLDKVSLLLDTHASSLRNYISQFRGILPSLLEIFPPQASILSATISSFEEAELRYCTAASCIKSMPLQPALIAVHFAFLSSAKRHGAVQTARPAPLLPDQVSTPIVEKRSTSAPPTPTVAAIKRPFGSATPVEGPAEERHYQSKRGGSEYRGRGGYKGKNFDPDYRGRGRGRAFRGWNVSRGAGAYRVSKSYI